MFNKPYFLYTHGVLAPFQRKVSFRKKSLYDWLIANRILNQASTIIFTSTGEMQETLPLNIKAPIAIIPHGIDNIFLRGNEPENSFRFKYLNNHKGPILLYLGRLNAKKGLDILIESFANVLKVIPDARLVIVGGWDPPSYKSKILNIVSNFSLNEKILFTGPLFGEEKYSAFIAADVFVLPSIAENFCTSMFEAMKCGLPVIISENLNLSHEVKEAKAGIVVKRDSDSFAQAIIDFFRGNMVRSELSENGLKFASSYTWEKTGLLLNEMIKNVVQLKIKC
jgi:glycosyltransferase involved in cell wall biosynthesis